MSHRALHSWTRDGHRVIDCADCGYCHLDPLPDRELLADYYRHAYHAQRPWAGAAPLSDAEIARRRRSAGQRPAYRAVLQAVERHLPPGATRRMLDAGGGSSLLACCFLDHGWQALVLEPNRDAAVYARQFGIAVDERMLEHTDVAQAGRFAFVNLHYVLEHVRDPAAILRRAGELLAPDGILRVCVPNDFSPGQLAWLAGSDLEPPWILHPDHVNYFSFESLVGLLQRCGFHELERTTDFPLEFLLLTGTDYYADPGQRERVGPAVQRFERAWQQSGQDDRLAALYAALADLGMGRSAVVYARRGSA